MSYTEIKELKVPQCNLKEQVLIQAKASFSPPPHPRCNLGMELAAVACCELEKIYRGLKSEIKDLMERR